MDFVGLAFISGVKTSGTSNLPFACILSAAPALISSAALPACARSQTEVSEGVIFLGDP